MGIEVCTSSSVADDAPFRSSHEYNMHVHARVGGIRYRVGNSMADHALVLPTELCIPIVQPDVHDRCC